MVWSEEVHNVFFFISATTEKTFVRDKFEEINFTFSSSDLKPII